MTYRKLFIVSLALISCSQSDKPVEKKLEEPVKTLSGSSEWKPASKIQELGAYLYFDKRLSDDNSLSCNTCHDITNQKGGVDNLPTSKGIKGQLGPRNAPTVWNAKFLSVQFWDGRAKDLAEQAKGPITNMKEMGMKSHDLAIERIKGVKGYQELFKEVFPKDENPIRIENVVQAIAAFEETLVATDSPFDRYKAGDSNALSPEAKRGWENFQAIGCTTCHSGDHFAGPPLPPGTGFYMKFPTFPNDELEKKYGFSKDPGRYEVTKNVGDKNMWRVPTLRNVALTAPYFHNGKVETLDEAVKVMAKLQLNRDLTEEERSSLVAFLKSLTSPLTLIREPKPLE